MKKNISVVRSKQRTVVIYYNGQPYAKITPKRQRRKISDEAKVVMGILIFFVAVIAGGFFFQDPTITKVEAKEIPKPIVIEKIVKVKDDSIPPILKKIFDCESGGKHYDKNGKVIKGKVDRDDTGIAQINLRYHGAEAKRLGYDLMTEKGNVGYAKYLLENFGTKFWSASAGCWSKK